ncbi:hypothetical protein PGT21_007768 [Puccinia graminis f. sp. tritici]|uniref:Uncharacterized protein n=1 Tax=Puccinia graminis f. sp. tritici TaxID=56615 RepID=A0A5B0N1B0_PUCGR|nr:hypothetical protein PGT21_007768 [Puccinia graminis f. sp. tritici]KAA1133513.1 hypothetical protein PGTUg99_020680 [Puccinia graminis f. sp. tritici]
MAAVANLAHQGTDPAKSSILAPLHNHRAQLTPLGKEQRKIAVALNPMFTDNEKPSTASRSSGAVTSVMTCVTQKDGPHRPTETWIGTTQAGPETKAHCAPLVTRRAAVLGHPALRPCMVRQGRSHTDAPGCYQFHPRHFHPT